jgi:uncharacterized protein DUF4232
VTPTSIRSRIRWAGVAAAACAVALAAGAAAARTTATVIPGCRTSGLVVWLDTSGNGAAGSFFYTLRLTNQSGRTCSLAGYPGVSGVDLRGRQLGRAASRNPSPVRRVTLPNGATAAATLRIVDALNFPAAVCRPTPAAGIRVYPPNQRASKTVPFPFTACSRARRVYLSVSAVRRSS